MNRHLVEKQTPKVYMSKDTHLKYREMPSFTHMNGGNPKSTKPLLRLGVKRHFCILIIGLLSNKPLLRFIWQNLRRK